MDRRWATSSPTGSAGRRTCPIPLELAVAGAVAALTVSFTVLAVAWRTPRYADERAAGRRPPGWPRCVGSRAWFVGAARPRDRSSSLYTVMVAVARRGQPDQPVLRHLLRLLWVGFVPLSLLLRPGLQGDQPGPHHQRGVRQGSRAATPTRGSSPTPSGSATGRQPWASSRSCGWSSSTRSRPSSARSGCGARPTSPRCCWAGRCSAARFYERADPFEVYSTLVVPDVGVGPAGASSW